MTSQPKGLKITVVPEDSIFCEFGVAVGDVLFAINGYPVTDELDVRFFEYDSETRYQFQRDTGEEYSVELNEVACDLGFEPMHLRHCRNKCVFCFVDQMPKGLRSSLYIKDEDYRFSFLDGAYLTLTSLSDQDLERILRLKLSPLYVSVHTTNPSLRMKMLVNKNAGSILNMMEALIQGGIDLHTQIVVMPGWNDGEELNRTLDDLEKYIPSVLSIAVVPIGLTKYRHDLTKLGLVSKEQAIVIIKEVHHRQKRLQDEYGANIVYAADEMYLIADHPFPDYEDYDDFPQIENGVGMVRWFQDEIKRALGRKKITPSKDIAVLTGLSMGKAFKEYFLTPFKNIDAEKFHIFPIENSLFGESVTVTGLLNGMDIINHIKQLTDYQKILLPANMFNFDYVTLDDYTLDTIRNLYPNQEIIAPVDGAEFIKAIAS